MHRGEIFLYSGTGLVAGLIKKVTDSPFSHVGWITSDHHVVEAEAHGTEKEPFPYDLEKVAIISLNASSEAIDACLKRAEELVGRPYDFKLFFGLFWRWLLGIGRKKKIRGWSSGYICSELVAKPILEKIGWSVTPDGVHIQNAVPGDFHVFAKANPDKVVLTHTGSKISW